MTATPQEAPVASRAGAAAQVLSCFYCVSLYGSGQISKWIDDGRTTLCIVLVIGEQLDVAFLWAMHRDWFQFRASFNQQAR